MSELKLPVELNNIKYSNVDNSIKIKDYLNLLNKEIPIKQFNNIYIVLFIILIIIYLHI